MKTEIASNAEDISIRFPPVPMQIQEQEVRKPTYLKQSNPSNVFKIKLTLKKKFLRIRMSLCLFQTMVSRNNYYILLNITNLKQQEKVIRSQR